VPGSVDVVSKKPNSVSDSRTRAAARSSGNHGRMGVVLVRLQSCELVHRGEEFATCSVVKCSTFGHFEESSILSKLGVKPVESKSRMEKVRRPMASFPTGPIVVAVQSLCLVAVKRDCTICVEQFSGHSGAVDRSKF